MSMSLADLSSDDEEASYLPEALERGPLAPSVSIEVVESASGSSPSILHQSSRSTSSSSSSKHSVASLHAALSPLVHSSSDLSVTQKNVLLAAMQNQRGETQEEEATTPVREKTRQAERRLHAALAVIQDGSRQQKANELRNLAAMQGRGSGSVRRLQLQASRESSKRGTISVDGSETDRMNSFRSIDEEQPAPSTAARRLKSAAVAPAPVETRVIPVRIHTLLYLCASNSWLFAYAFIVFLLQLASFGLWIYDAALEDDNTSNSALWNLPPTAPEPHVAVAQMAALIWTAWATLDAPIPPSHDARLLPDAGQWIRAECAWLLTAAAFCASNLLATLQATQVSQIIIQTATLYFLLYATDTLAIRICRLGWMGELLQSQVARIEQRLAKIPLAESAWSKHRITSLLLFGGLVAVWATAYVRQSSGDVLRQTSCPHVHVQFGEGHIQGVSLSATTLEAQAFSPFLNTTHPPAVPLSAFSGTYLASENGELVDHRLVYHQEGQSEDPTAGKIYYCEAVRAWLFVVDALQVPTETLICQWGWLAQSPSSVAWSLAELEESSWSVYSSPTPTTVSMQCTACQRDTDCGVNRGTCVNQQCACQEEFLGPFCQYEPSCSTLVRLDSSSEYGPYQAVTDRHAYNRPIYISSSNSDNETTEDAILEVLLYTGNQWQLSLVPSLDWQEQLSNDDKQQTSLHAYWSGLLQDPVATSSPTTSYLPTDDSLTWHRADVSPLAFPAAMDTTFACLSVDCSQPNACGTGNTCVPDQPLSVSNVAVTTLSSDTALLGGVCQCQSGLVGRFCEKVVSTTAAADD